MSVRLRQSAIAGMLVLITSLTAYKCGFRGKLQPIASHTTWDALAATLPSHFAFAVLAGVIYYLFFWGRRG